jgi:hypothetical protein
MTVTFKLLPYPGPALGPVQGPGPLRPAFTRASGFLSPGRGPQAPGPQPVGGTVNLFRRTPQCQGLSVPSAVTPHDEICQAEILRTRIPGICRSEKHRDRGNCH